MNSGDLVFTGFKPLILLKIPVKGDCAGDTING